MIPVLVHTTATDTTTPLKKNVITYRSLAINDPTDSEDNTYLIEDATASPVFNQNIEPLPDRAGSRGYEPVVVYRMIRLRGWVKAPSEAKLIDKVMTLNEAFDPYKAFLADTGTYNKGYLPMTFNLPTTDTGNYATGLIPVQYYVQPLRHPVEVLTKFDGDSARIDMILRAADPRLYLQSTSSANRTGNGDITATNTLATFPSYPTITIATTTAPSGSPTIARTSPSGGTLTFDGTALAASTTYTLDMAARTFQISGGADKINAIDGGSEFFDIQAQSNTITLAGWPSDVVVTVTWRRAFA